MSRIWRCPYCDHSQIVTDDNSHTQDLHIVVGYEEDELRTLRTLAIRCLNAKCNKMFLKSSLFESRRLPSGTRQVRGHPIKEWSLLPDGSCRAVHECIPTAIRQDYEEACSIVSKSPKASATLIRRCLQGMIHDFCGIKDKTLNIEIRKLIECSEDGSLPREVSTDSINAIDKLRKIGNVGAHMEHDVNHIIEIDEGEAELLIGLVEMLFEDWYVERYKRKQRFLEIERVANEKEALRKQGFATLPPSPEPPPLSQT